MKKIYIVFVLIFLTSSAYADKLLKSGFLSGEWDLDINFKVDNPKDKIIIIYNHGSDENDKPSKNCQWKNNVRNFAALSGKKIKNKEILVYSFCSDNLGGDDWKIFWKKKDVKYQGTPKLEKRVEANHELIEKFINLGVPNNQIFISGHSCGGWLTMMFMAKYPNKIAGGISTHHACYGKLSTKYKVKKVGEEEALKKFKKKKPVASYFRTSQIKAISEAKNLPVLIFTHPKDPFDGLLSDWVEDIPGTERIVISEDFKINNKSCKRIGINNGERWTEPLTNGHWMSFGDCFQYYNSKILEFVQSKI
ncbi:hypothetical protein IDH11_00675 [Pelagibacterales bacterium SAG-MED30]|jgi:predicted esterase|nr:hypothetical protein [Pelagibacterales bacterium SAG-MED30]|tara:strand:+ start:160 stop:1080 length:921 start_codon:yes stop_codon:yes gene_type:complete